MHREQTIDDRSIRLSPGSGVQDVGGEVPCPRRGHTYVSAAPRPYLEDSSIREDPPRWMATSISRGDVRGIKWTKGPGNASAPRPGSFRISQRLLHKRHPEANRDIGSVISNHSLAKLFTAPSHTFSVIACAACAGDHEPAQLPGQVRRGAFQRPSSAIIAARNEGSSPHKNTWRTRTTTSSALDTWTTERPIFFHTRMLLRQLDTDHIRDTYNARLTLGFELSEKRWTPARVEIVDYLAD